MDGEVVFLNGKELFTKVWQSQPFCMVVKVGVWVIVRLAALGRQKICLEKCAREESGRFMYPFMQ